MSFWKTPFEKVNVGEEFADQYGDVFEKTSDTSAECVRSSTGAYVEGDVQDFAGPEIVELKN